MILYMYECNIHAPNNKMYKQKAVFEGGTQLNRWNVVLKEIVSVNLLIMDHLK